LIVSQKTLEEIKIRKEANGNTIDATILSRKMGVYPIQVIASVVGIAAAGAGLTNAGGGGLFKELQLAEGPLLSFTVMDSSSIISSVQPAVFGIAGVILSMIMGQGSGSGGSSRGSSGGGSSEAEASKLSICNVDTLLFWLYLLAGRPHFI
jgi:hypothetical protein